MWLNFLYKVNADKDIVYLLIRTVLFMFTRFFYCDLAISASILKLPLILS